MGRQDFNIIQLPVGRKLSYAEYGDPRGMPVFSSTAFLARAMMAKNAGRLPRNWASG